MQMPDGEKKEMKEDKGNLFKWKTGKASEKFT